MGVHKAEGSSYRTAFLALVIGIAGSCASADEFDAPASYYSGATGTGSTLKSQLTTAMTVGHIQRNYGDFRVASRTIDQDPNNPLNILLVYNGFSVSGLWDSGSTWNREHVWPQSRQPGSASNSSMGNLGDPHALRPCNPSINSSRGNKPFGTATTFGGFRSLGVSYFPGDVDKGDIARSLFYSDTRWSSLGLSLVNGTPSGNQMGDLGALVAWHYLDAPDTFERRRNHAVFDSALNPFFFTNNRNAYIDRPELVWSVYMNQNNDSTLWVGDSPAADGSSVLDVVINAIVGDSVEPVPVTIEKEGSDGTYYTVIATSGLESSVWEEPSAFPMNTPSDFSMFMISLPAGATDTASSSMEQVVIDNLDVTTAGGAGNGANDADDIVQVEINVFNPSMGSLAQDSGLSEITIDLGSIAMGSGDVMQTVEFFNRASAPFGAPLEILLMNAAGDTAELGTDFNGLGAIGAESSSSINAILDDATVGEFSATYTFNAVNDESLFGAASGGDQLVVHLMGEVVEGICAADFAEPMGVLDFFDVSAFLSAFGSEDPQADLNDDGVFDFFDVSEFLTLYGAGCP